MQDGIYFALSDTDYHNLPHLSASGIKNLLISPMDFWARSWMNPLRSDEGTEAMFVGRAYHKRILEGKAAFDECYAPAFAPPADCLRTVDDIKDALIKCGIEKPKGLKAELIEKLLEIQPTAQIADELRADYELLHHGKEFLSQNMIGSIEVAAAMIENHPEISKCFRGGYPEVTVIWTEDGIRFKSRFDYLKPRAIIDLKTFENRMSKPVDSAIYGAMASGKYHIQAAFYLRAVAKAVEFVAATMADPSDKGRKVHGLTGEGFDPKWFMTFESVKEHDFFFVFQQKGIAPLARAKKFTRGSLWSCGEVAIDEAIRRYKFYMDKHGEHEPWVDDAPITEFEDSLFPAYTTEL